MICLEKCHIFRSQEWIWLEFIEFDNLPVTWFLIGPWVYVCNLDLSSIINKNIFRFDISQLQASIFSFLEGSSQSKKSIPQLWLFEVTVISFFVSFLYKLWEKIGIERILVLDKAICTVSVPVFPQSPVSLLYFYFVGTRR